MTQEHPKPLAYLLRLWLVEDEQGLAWRAALEDVHTHARWGFGSVEKMLVFLQEQMRLTTNPTPESHAQ